MNNTNNTRTLLNFFRINRLLSYVVLAMVLPSIAWPAGSLPAGSLPEGPDYEGQSSLAFGSGLEMDKAVFGSTPVRPQGAKTAQRGRQGATAAQTDLSFSVENPFMSAGTTLRGKAPESSLLEALPSSTDSRSTGSHESTSPKDGEPRTGATDVKTVDMKSILVTPVNAGKKNGSTESDDSTATPPKEQPTVAIKVKEQEDVVPPSCGQRWYKGLLRLFWGKPATEHTTEPTEDPIARIPELTTAINVSEASGVDPQDNVDGDTQVVPNPLHQAAGRTEGEDKPLTPEELAALKPFNDYMQKTFNMKMTTRDVVQYVAAALLTGALGMELWGEYQMTIDRVFTSLLATSPELAKALLYDPATRWFKPLFSQYFLINVIVSLVPYLPFRLYQFVRTITPGVENGFKGTMAFLKPHCPKVVQAYMPTYGPATFQSFAKPIAWWTQGLGYLFVLLGAAAIGMGPAYESYASNAPWAAQGYAFYANTIPAFIFIFYTLDAMLRLENLKTKAFHRIFVRRGDPAAEARATLNDDLRNAKQGILEQSSTALKATLDKMAEADGIGKMQILRGLGKRRGLRAPSQGPKPRSARQRLRQFSPHVLAGIVSLPIAYLAGRSSYGGIHEALEYLATGKPGTSLYDEVIINQALMNAEFQAEQRPLWERDINNNTIVFNGLGPSGGDWCSQCLGPPEWGNYLLVWDYPPNPKNTLINFYHCPGVIKTGDLAANTATDPLYTEDTCQGLFGYYDYWVHTPDAYTNFIDALAPHLNPANNMPTYTSPPGADVGAALGAALSALAQYGMSVLALKGFFERWINSYRKHPMEVLPAKRNTYLTTAVMAWALIQSFVRSAPVLISGLRLLYNDHMDPILRWIVLGAATTSSMATYFPEFDETYSRIPKWVANDGPWAILGLYNLSKKKLRAALGWPGTPDFTFKVFGKPVGQLTFPQRDEVFGKIDEARGKLAGTYPKIVEVLDRAGCQSPSPEMMAGVR